MNKNLLSVTQWKFLLISLALTCFALDVWANFYWDREVSPEEFGFGIKGGEMRHDRRFQIEKFTTDSSPLKKAGARVGDFVAYDRLGDARRNRGADDSIGMTIFSAQGSTHVSIRPIPIGHKENSAIALQVLSLFRWAINYLSLLVAVLIGLRRADDGPMRIFSLSILAYSCADISRTLPGSVLQNFWSLSLEPFVLMAFYALFAYFSLIFPKERPHARFGWVRRAFYAYVAAYTAFFICLVARHYDVLPLALLGYVPLLDFWHQAMVIVSVFFSLVALWFSWHRSEGTTRQRLAWIGVCMGSVYSLPPVFILLGAVGIQISGDLYPIVNMSIQLLAYCGFAYAMLRHRLFDFGFAVNRALVFTIISTLLLLVFSFTEWSVDKLLHFEGREKNVIVDAFVALGIILSFHRIQHWVNHKVYHTFFHHWYEAAETLRHFLDKAMHISDAPALQEKFILAVEEFAGAGGGAIYALDAQGGFKLTHSTLQSAPTSIDMNNDAVIDMRHTRTVVELAERGQDLPGELAFPMMARGAVIGLVLVGAKTSGRNFRPDEVALLTKSVRQFGMDLETLRLAELERSAAALEQKAMAFEQKSAAFEREANTLRQIINGERDIQSITR